MSFYMTYMARWPDYFHTAVNPGDRVMGYSMSPSTLPMVSCCFLLILPLCLLNLWIVNPGFCSRVLRQ